MSECLTDYPWDGIPYKQRPYISADKTTKKRNKNSPFQTPGNFLNTLKRSKWPMAAKADAWQ